MFPKCRGVWCHYRDVVTGRVLPEIGQHPEIFSHPKLPEMPQSLLRTHIARGWLHAVIENTQIHIAVVRLELALCRLQIANTGLPQTI